MFNLFTQQKNWMTVQSDIFLIMTLQDAKYMIRNVKKRFRLDIRKYTFQ